MKTIAQLEQALSDAKDMEEYRARLFTEAKADVLNAQRGGTYNSDAMHRMVQGSADLDNARSLVQELEHAIWVRQR